MSIGCTACRKLTNVPAKALVGLVLTIRASVAVLIELLIVRVHVIGVKERHLELSVTQERQCRQHRRREKRRRRHDLEQTNKRREATHQTKIN